MASLTNFVRLLLLTAFILAASNATAQDELRKTFFKDVDKSKAAAEQLDAGLLAPKSYGEGMKDYQSAEQGLQRGRNIEYVRDKVAELASHKDEACRAA